jgi:anti-sigma factor RsiW
MMHVEQGTLQAYLDAEVSAAARADIDNHLHACSECAAELHRLREAADLFAAAVRDTDVMAPVLAAQARFVTARRFEPALVAPRPRRAFARAAMFVVGLGAVASAAVPGSPVRAWIGGALTRAGLLDDTQSAAAPALPDEVPAVQRDVGESTALGIEAVNGRVRIVLKNVKPQATVSVHLVNGERAIVEAVGAAAKARFRTGAGLLEVDGVAGGSVVVQIPRSLNQATVEQDGRTIFKAGF